MITKNIQEQRKLILLIWTVATSRVSFQCGTATDRKELKSFGFCYGTRALRKTMILEGPPFDRSCWRCRWCGERRPRCRPDRSRRKGEVRLKVTLTSSKKGCIESVWAGMVMFCYLKFGHHNIRHADKRNRLLRFHVVLVCDKPVFVFGQGFGHVWPMSHYILL